MWLIPDTAYWAPAPLALEGTVYPTVEGENLRFRVPADSQWVVCRHHMASRPRIFKCVFDGHRARIEKAFGVEFLELYLGEGGAA